MFNYYRFSSRLYLNNLFIPSVEPIYKKRSILELECSGPAPSNPWGRKHIKDDYLNHFASEQVIKVSKITYAVLKKSAN
jgi:hypothetical protein